MQAKTERFEMRLDQETIHSVDTWRGQQEDMPSRSEAVRRLTEAGLAATGDRKFRFSDGEKLILFMLADLKKSLKAKGEIDADLITSALVGGHHWAIGWQYEGLFPTHEDSEQAVSEVVDFLDMWVFIERAFEGLSDDDKETLKTEAAPFGERVRFPGFDGNNESEHLAIARFMTDRLGRFPSLKGKVTNSHHPTLKNYRSMVANFETMRPGLVGRELHVGELIRLLKRT